MADLRISELPALAGANLAAGDLLPIVDVSASETKKITVTDLVGNATTLIADATIPSAKVLFGSGSIVAASLATDAVTTAKIQNDAVTAAKLADESTVDLVTTLPGSGAFVGQIALDTDDSNAYIWNGSSWVSFKAAGSVGSVVGSTAGVINIVVSTSGNDVTVSATLDNTGAAAQFLAGPSGSAGAVSYRTITAADLPTATTSTKGAVQVNGNGLTLSGDEIQIDNTVTANTSQYHLTQYDANGLVTAGRQITATDLPAATASVQGAVYPGSGLAVSSGQLNHSNSVTAGTYTKVTVDGQGHVTTGTTLGAADIPSLDATKVATGQFGAARLSTGAVTGVKLADSSTVQFGGAGSTAGIVTFPTAEFKGQYFWDELNGDLYLWSGSAWLPVTITSGELIFAGTYDASINEVASTTTAGAAAGYTAGAALPAASSTNNRHYLVVSESGTGTGNAPAEALAPPDMILSNGATYDLIDVSNAIAGQTATNISFTPYGNISSTNVQLAIQELDDEKLAKAGGTVTGNLEIGTTGSLTFEGSTADGFETTLAVTDPTADRTITLPNATGTVALTSDLSLYLPLAGGTLTGNILLNSQSDIRFGDADNSNYLSFQAPASVTSDVTFTLPNGDGTANQALATNGSGTLSWVSFFQSSGGALTGDVTLNAQSDLRFADSDSSNWVAFQAPATIASNVTWTLPSVDGSSGQALSTNGTGTLSWSSYGSLDTAQTWTKGQRAEVTALTDAATVAVDFADSNNFSVTLGGNRTLGNPSNQVAGQSGSLFVTQDGTGSRTLAYSSDWEFAGGTAPTLSTAANAVDRIDYIVRASGSIHAVLTKAFA